MSKCPTAGGLIEPVGHAIDPMTVVKQIEWAARGGSCVNVDENTVCVNVDENTVCACDRRQRVIKYVYIQHVQWLTANDHKQLYYHIRVCAHCFVSDKPLTMEIVDVFNIIMYVDYNCITIV